MSVAEPRQREKNGVVYTKGWVADLILDLAGYTYGPLLGLFAFGIFTKRRLPERWTVTAVCLLAPVICYLISNHAAAWFGGFQIGIELLLVNGVLTFLGLWVISTPSQTKSSEPSL